MTDDIHRYFNPRSPQGERLNMMGLSDLTNLFQSTLPARGATAALPFRRSAGRDFNPRSPQGERLGFLATLASSASFQSTLPARGATSCTWILSPGI